MSDTNSVGIAIARSTATTYPLAAPDPLNLQALRTTGLPNLAFNPSVVTSNEFRQDGQVTDIIRVGGEAGGDDNFELSYGAHDDLMEASLFNVFDTTEIKSGTTGITGFGAGTVDVDDGTDFIENMIVELRNLSVGDQGRGIYFVDSISVDELTASAFDSDTNALAGTFTAQDAAPASDQLATELQVVGYRADAAGEIALTVSGGVATLTASGGSTFTGVRGGGVDLAAGNLIKLAGFPLATSNVYARLLSASATTLTFEAPSGMVDDAAASERAQIFFGDQLINGTQAVSAHQFAVELSFNDHSPVTRKLFLGMAVNAFNLQINSQSIVTGNATFFGLEGKFSTGENAGTGQGELYNSGLVINRLSAAQNDVYNSSSHVGRLGRGASPVSAGGLNFVLDASLNITRNLRRNNAVGFEGAAAIGRGEVGVTGNLNTYFDNPTLAQQVIDGGDTSLDVYFVGSDGRAIAYDMPRIKFTGGAPTIPGKNQDVVIPLQYQAIRSATLGYTVGVTRFPFVA